MTELINDREYQWNQNWANQIAHTADVSKVIDELESIRETRGDIKPEYVIESSKNKSSILHSYFQWDDAKAAHSWRLRQASRLLQNIEVKVVKDGNPVVVRVYETVKKGGFSIDNPNTYKKFDLLNEEDVFRVIKIITSDLIRIGRKLSGYPGTKSAVTLIEKAIEELQKEEKESPVIQITDAADTARLGVERSDQVSSATV